LSMPERRNSTGLPTQSAIVASRLGVSTYGAA
jgi:hypothetical protein